MNWGTKIVLGMVAFMLFIIGMVVYMFKVHGNDALVDENYYEKGIDYDREYNAKQNVLDDEKEPEITITKTQIIIQLKDSASYEIKLMRPSTTKDDIRKRGSTIGDNHLVLIDRQDMPAGLWFLELEWLSKSKSYLFKKDLKL
ncbi:MAG: nitrogen fixation protein FixH [Pedobacter sp.]|nr:MAG: nitrogen fixation protein FixH [Pedobacter sp.]